MEIFLGLLWLLAVAFYFLPWLIAGARNAGHRNGILAVNFLFGWTVLGWIAALIWAIVEQPAVGANNYSPVPGAIHESPRQTSAEIRARLAAKG